MNITAYSYIIYEPDWSKTVKEKAASNSKYQNSHKVHISSNSRNSVEVASLTKIMTCLVAIEISEKYNLKLSDQIINIGKF